MKTKNFVLAMVLLFSTLGVFGQSKLTPKQILKKNYQPVVTFIHDNEPVPDQFPSYPSGIQGLYKDIVNKLVYPRNALKERVAGKVVVSFVVETDGSVGQVQVVKSVSKLLDDEAIWLVKHLKPWVPGYKDGKPVDVSYNLPIDFRIPKKYATPF
ncbi:MAG: energy transducer TonB [Bacteroidales bacterium]|nr:energy transducer TonB [Bacteroidales bacterium]